MGLALFTLVVACPGSPRATTQEWSTIAGAVRDITTSEPVAFADVTVLSMGMGTFTKQDGRFVILRIHPGDYSVRACSQNYERSDEVHLTVSPSETTEVTFELWPLYDDTKPRKRD
jgi:hypothetical protein